MKNPVYDFNQLMLYCDNLTLTADFENGAREASGSMLPGFLRLPKRVVDRAYFSEIENIFSPPILAPTL